MNIEKRFLDIQKILTKHSFLTDKEALDRYPLTKNQYTDWIEDILELDTQETIKLHNTLDDRIITNKDYASFLQEAKKLTSLPQSEEAPTNFPINLSKKITAKKRHEISYILSLKPIKESNSFVDIGSGAGHLSSCILNKNQKKSICIDMSEDIQNIGKEKLKKIAPDILSRVQFVTSKISSRSSTEDFEESDTLIGLHACGDLSTIIVKAYGHSKIKNLINFGCCYHKLADDQFNISKIAMKNPLILTNHALTMAAKFKPENIKSYNEKLKVKKYRYSLHFLMLDELGLEFASVGNGLKEDYKLSFADYCYKFLPDSMELSHAELENKYKSLEKKVTKVLALGLIRSHLARLIEIYIILDRALYLKENGINVEIKEVFNKEISPRNILLRATNSTL